MSNDPFYRTREWRVLRATRLKLDGQPAKRIRRGDDQGLPAVRHSVPRRRVENPVLFKKLRDQ
jgi:hypothetical protein